jgi:hypothetical protein
MVSSFSVFFARRFNKDTTSLKKTYKGKLNQIIKIMKRYQQLLVLPLIAFGFMACMQANKSEKYHKASTETAIQQQPVLSLADTSLKKVVKTDAEWKVLTDNHYAFCVKGTERPYQMKLI